MTTFTKNDLTELGFKVRFHHLRIWLDRASGVGIIATEPPPGPGWELWPRGGETHCRIMRGDDVVAAGSTRVNPLDNYCKAMGRTMALGRAVQVLVRDGVL